MGVYLSVPIRDKVSEDDERPHLRYGASSMQGWRTSQEDAHNCCLDFDPDTNTSLFACYDGHGGAEVAQYTAKHFPDFLKNLDAYTENRPSHALEEAFLGFDATLKEEQVIQTLKEIAGVDGDGEESDAAREESATLYEEATMPLEELLSRYGRGGTANAMKEKLKSLASSPSIRARSNGDIKTGDSKDDVKPSTAKDLVNGHSDSDPTSQGSSCGEVDSALPQANEAQAKEETDSKPIPEDPSRDGISCVDSTTSDDFATKEGIIRSSTVESESAKLDLNSQAKGSAAGSCTSNFITTDIAASTQAGVTDSNSNGKDSNERPSSTTTATHDEAEEQEPGGSLSSFTASEPSGSAACGSSSSGAGSSSARISSQSAAPESSSSSSTGSSSSSSMSDETGPCSSSKQEPEAGSSTGRTRFKRKNIIPEEGEDESSFDEDSSDDDEDEDDDDDDDEGEEPWVTAGDNSSDDDDEDEEEEDEDEDEDDEGVMGGNEEPGSDSGCTAVVALVRGRDLYVANAGDSRCILCRGGKAVDMSIDHKPEDDLEHSRITKAGGRVTMDGRVNGGLNLSRAIGDHCYKRNAELSAREQMITAQPDVRSMRLQDNDDFMVLACDGIWNVMTSQDVVNFVAERLKAGATKLSAICEEMFEYCLAPDTTGDGAGCDNMTCIIVRFNMDNMPAPSAGGALKRTGDDSAETVDGGAPDDIDAPDAKKSRIETEAS